MVDFNLLRHLSQSLRQDASSLELDELEDKTEEYTRLHNKIMDFIWSLKIRINNIEGDRVLKVELMKERDNLSKLLEDCSSEQQIRELHKKIQKKQEQHGRSKVATPSPCP